MFWVATAGAIGCNAGSVVAYWIGAKGGRPLVERYGRWVLMSHHDLDRMTLFFNKYGSITVLIARLLPVVRTFIAFPAGIAKMPQVRFHIYTFVGSWPWCFALAYAGMKLGEKWHTDPRVRSVRSTASTWWLRSHLWPASSGSSGLTSSAAKLNAALRAVGRLAHRLEARTLFRPASNYFGAALIQAIKGRVRRTMRKEEQGGQKTDAKIAPATGKLGVMVVGLGAVATTMIAGVEAIRRGLAKPIGSLTQMGTIRLGKRTDNKSPLMKDFVPLADLNDSYLPAGTFSKTTSTSPPRTLRCWTRRHSTS